MSTQLLALLTAFSFATANIIVRQGLKYSTPTTATLFSLTSHTILLCGAVFLTGGIPKVVPIAVLAITITAILQPVMRFCHYTGIDKIGASRAVTLRNTFPVLSVIIGITILHEDISIIGLIGTALVVMGIILTSWKLEKRLTSSRLWYLLFPLTAALVTGVVHPIRRYALTISDEPLFFAALVGPISLICFIGYLALPTTTERPVWNQKAFLPFAVAGLFETLGVLLMLIAFATGPVVIVSPITATTPIWTLLMAVIFLRDLERISASTVIGTLCVVAGVIAISMVE